MEEDLGIGRKVLDRQHRILVHHGAPTQGHVVGQYRPHRWQRHCSDDREEPRVDSGPGQDSVAHVHAQLAHRHRTELDLISVGQRVTAGRGRLHRAKLRQYPQHRHLLMVDHQLPEAEHRPPGYAGLMSHGLRHGVRRPRGPAALRLDERCPVPAVPHRVAGQPAQASAEHERDCEGRDGDDRAPASVALTGAR